MAEPVRFLFDFLSPYAYLAWTEIHPIARKHGRDVEPVPVLLAALLDHHQHKGPAEIPAKRAYLIKDVMRTARRLKLPLGLPPAHPFNPLLALRLATLDLPHADRVHLIGVLFRAVWGGRSAGSAAEQQRGVETPDALRPLLEAEGFAADQLLARAHEPETKAKLKRATDQAILEGAFGVPTMLVDGELFWGFDSLGHLAGFLDGKDVLDLDLVQSWMSLPATAVRPGAAGKA
jgi:2-hydroxychromene-2-carboxylate isomerase